jgi:hypothetical protein
MPATFAFAPFSPRGQQDRQCAHRFVDQREHRGARNHGAIEHAVQQILDPPAELAERKRTDQPAGAFEGVERTPDRLEFLEGGDIALPQRQLAAEIADFLFDFLEEHLADVVVDFLACDRFEAAQRLFVRRHLLFDLFLDLDPVAVGCELVGRTGLGQAHA